jgi:GNAT superfamily N-acetyltransferase
VHETEVRALRKNEHRAAAAVTSRALADSPTSVAMYGDDPLGALAGLYRELGSFFELLPPPQFAAFAGDCVVAAAGVAPPGGCIGSFMVGNVSELLGAEPAPVGDPARAHAFWARWAQTDLGEEHWHLGPVGVEPGFQGRGIGGRMMRQVCAWLDEGDRLAWLETDKERNVRFYSSLGFELASVETVLGVETWYMRRDPVR